MDEFYYLFLGITRYNHTQITPYKQPSSVNKIYLISRNLRYEQAAISAFISVKCYLEDVATSINLAA